MQNGVVFDCSLLLLPNPNSPETCHLKVSIEHTCTADAAQSSCLKFQISCFSRGTERLGVAFRDHMMRHMVRSCGPMKGPGQLMAQTGRSLAHALHCAITHTHRMCNVFVDVCAHRFWHSLTEVRLRVSQFTPGRCWLTWWAAWPGSSWTSTAAWTSVCPSSGSCSSRRVPSSAGSGRFTERSGTARSRPKELPPHPHPPLLMLLFPLLCVQERQLLQVLSLLLCVHLSVRHLRDPVYRHHELGHQVRSRIRSRFSIGQEV